MFKKRVLFTAFILVGVVACSNKTEDTDTNVDDVIGVTGNDNSEISDAEPNKVEREDETPK